jgi:3-mercaptopyruvate sulfurtransferase SseA
VALGGKTSGDVAPNGRLAMRDKIQNSDDNLVIDVRQPKDWNKTTSAPCKHLRAGWSVHAPAI